MTPPHSVAEAYAVVRDEIRRACVAAGRDETTVRLLPVSKTQPAARLREAMAAGATQFGENRVQEMTAKAAELGNGVSWVLIGHLQRNKVAAACTVMDELQSLDSLELARALEAQYAATRPGDQLAVLVEVNTSAETSKSGVRADAAMEFTRALRDYPHLRPQGLMTVAHPDPELASRGFACLAGLQARLRDRDGGGWNELSMGMSGDFASAIAHGSTCVRIGTAIFGQRAAR